MGHFVNPKDILGPCHLAESTAWRQWKWNTWPQWSSTEGIGESGSVKQIMHMSSLSCRSPAPLSHPCRHGRHTASPAIPPHGWPQGLVLVQEVAR